MIKYYGLFYTDKDGYVLPWEKNGQLMIFPDKLSADFAKKEMINHLNNLLYPIETYKVKRKFFTKIVEKVEHPKLPEHTRILYNRVIKTLSVQALNIVPNQLL